MQGRKRSGPDLPLLRRFYPQNLDAQPTAGFFQYRRENPSRSAFSEIPPLALQAAGRRLLPHPAKPVQNQSAVPVISGSPLIGFTVPIAQSTERECPKLQVAGESPAGDTISSGCGSTAECGRAKAETTSSLGRLPHYSSERRRVQVVSRRPLQLRQWG